MKCPFCSYQEDKVIDSRPTDEGATIRRRRECLSCHKRYTTYEKVESLPVMVVKKDGSRQPYEREKVRKGILRACEKRSVSVDQIESIVDDIESHISNSLEREVTSEFIGELVMERLRGLDEVAYVRFASVYRQFKDINTFMAELNKLLNDK
jgi:transcriptional repressor NrdR